MDKYHVVLTLAWMGIALEYSLTGLVFVATAIEQQEWVKFVAPDWLMIPNWGDWKGTLLYDSPIFESSKFYFADHFDDITKSRELWTSAQLQRYGNRTKNKPISGGDYENGEGLGPWDLEVPRWQFSRKDKGLVLKSKSAAVSARFSKDFIFKEIKPLIVQCEITLPDESSFHGAAYVKLLPAAKDLSTFNERTPFTIKFGPHKCRNGRVKIVASIWYITASGCCNELKQQCKMLQVRSGQLLSDGLPHLYQLIVYPNSTYQIALDRYVISSGSLLTDFGPCANSLCTEQNQVTLKALPKDKNLKKKTANNNNKNMKTNTDDAFIYSDIWPMIESAVVNLKKPRCCKMTVRPKLLVLPPIGAIGYHLWFTSERVLVDNLIVTDDVDAASEMAFGFEMKWDRIPLGFKLTKLGRTSRLVMLIISIILGLISFFLYCMEPPAPPLMNYSPEIKLLVWSFACELATEQKKISKREQ